MLELNLFNVGATAGAMLMLAHYLSASDPNLTKKNECSTLNLTTAQWNAAEIITNVLKPTELLSEEDNT